MQIGVISDTHGHTQFLLPAVEKMAQRQVRAVLHCGDIGSAQIVRLLAAWPVHYVLGNCDHDREAPRLSAVMEPLGHTLHGRYGELELEDRKIALLHGDDERLLRHVILSEEFDLVCSGHTHEASLKRHGRTTVLNPGALYRANPHTMAIVNLDDMEVEIVEL